MGAVRPPSGLQARQPMRDRGNRRPCRGARGNVRGAIRDPKCVFVAHGAHCARGHRPRGRLHAERDALRARVGALEAGSMCCARSPSPSTIATRCAPRPREKQGLKTKLGFTFRYSPAMQYAKSLIDEGFIGTPFIFNGYEQNSQWLNPDTPASPGESRGRSVGDPGVVARGYGRRSWTSDISSWAAASAGSSGR
jgi:hypothetical protein